ncbi:hypothetical protein PR202_ga07255 [Eleusine coracana subsp. coracana]|uniref:Uncharacterized protein n=1 Tax=Eleusine coracana subsp. coracana TaxID=191504 RepID=A0AAV5BX49_ELECO|nr:hypothetical protein PR202_ga07255 [Eleusine coracana subsp. coracana]
MILGVYLVRVDDVQIRVWLHNRRGTPDLAPPKLVPCGLRDPNFLRRFRDLHQPYLIGFFLDTSRPGFPKFVEMPYAPKEKELASVARLIACQADSGFDDYFRILDCRNHHQQTSSSQPWHRQRIRIRRAQPATP